MSKNSELQSFIFLEYIGTKDVKATPMNLGDYEKYRGHGFRVDQTAYPINHPGYLVEYDKDSKPNDTRHKGYISWSPKETFEKSYRLKNKWHKNIL